MVHWLSLVVILYTRTCVEATSTPMRVVLENSHDLSNDPADSEKLASILDDFVFVDSWSEDESANFESTWPFHSPLATSSPSGELDASSFANVVVIPDIHGDKDSFLKSLWISFRTVEREFIELDQFTRHIGYFLANPVDPRGPLSRAPTRTVMIQIGDVVDRGPHGLECLHILDVIEAAIGWRLVRLYGNHEIMSHRAQSAPYIHPMEEQTFAKFFKSPSARIEQFARGSALWSRISASSLLMARINTGSTDPGSASALFVHGGVDLHWIDVVLESYGLAGGKTNVDILNELTLQTVTNQKPVLSLDTLDERLSPIWTRDLALLNQRYVCLNLLPRVLKYFNVARLIVGHTPQYDREMKSLCGSRLVLADAAMSEWMMDGETGNPTALIMKQSEGELRSLDAIYLEEDEMKIRKQSFYDAVTGGKDYKPVKARSHPAKYSSAPTGCRSTHNVRYEFQGLAQELAGEETHTMMEKLMLERPVVAVGVPLIVYVSAPSDDPNGSTFHVLLHTHGAPLRAMVDITAAIRRQIYDILLELWTAGYTIEYRSAALQGEDPEEVLELFVMDTVTGLVQFVDFAALRPKSVTCELENFVGHFAADLHMIEPDDEESLDEIRLISEIFNLSRIQTARIQAQFLDVVADRAVITTTSGPRDEQAAIWAELREMYDMPPSEMIDTPIETEWGVTDLELLFESQSVSVYRCAFSVESPVNRTVSVVIHTPRSAGGVIDMLLKTPANGLPPILQSTDRSDGSRFFAVDVNPRWIAPLRDALKEELVRNQAQVAQGILGIVSQLHALRVMLYFDPKTVKDDIARRFYVDVGLQDVYLFDVSQLGKTVRADTETAEELALVLGALREMFPSAMIEDVVPSTTQAPAL